MRYWTKRKIALNGVAMEYYTFEIDGEKVGYYEESDDGSTFYCNAIMEMDGQQFENPFCVKYEGDQVVAYKFDDVGYIDFDQEQGVYPTSALNILVKKMHGKDKLEYVRYHESREEVIGPAKLVREGSRITEIIDGKAGRYLVLDDDKVVEYGWGGTAKSKIVNSLEEAKRGTVFA